MYVRCQVNLFALILALGINDSYRIHVVIVVVVIIFVIFVFTSTKNIQEMPTSISTNLSLSFSHFLLLLQGFTFIESTVIRRPRTNSIFLVIFFPVHIVSLFLCVCTLLSIFIQIFHVYPLKFSSNTVCSREWFNNFFLPDINGNFKECQKFSGSFSSHVIINYVNINIRH